MDKPIVQITAKSTLLGLFHDNCSTGRIELSRGISGTQVPVLHDVCRLSKAIRFLKPAWTDRCRYSGNAFRIQTALNNSRNDCRQPLRSGVYASSATSWDVPFAVWEAPQPSAHAAGGEGGRARAARGLVADQSLGVVLHTMADDRRFQMSPRPAEAPNTGASEGRETARKWNLVANDTTHQRATSVYSGRLEGRGQCLLTYTTNTIAIVQQPALCVCCIVGLVWNMMFPFGFLCDLAKGTVVYTINIDERLDLYAKRTDAICGCTTN